MSRPVGYKPKYYCVECGALCRVETQVVGYDRYSGDAAVVDIATCPNAQRPRWYQISRHAYRETYRDWVKKKRE